jgi:hypothetical protein
MEGKKRLLRWIQKKIKIIVFILVSGGVLAVAVSELFKRIFPENSPPQAVIVVSQSHGRVPLTILFDGQKSQDPEGKSLSYDWFIDEKEVSKEKSLKYTFDVPKRYKVLLEVEDPKGLKNRDVLFIMAEQAGPETDDCDPGFYQAFNQAEEVQVRREIGRYLREKNIRQAICLLKYLYSDQARDEETRLVFNYCIKNHRLAEAERTLKYFRFMEQIKAAETELYLQRMKE